MEYKGYTGQFTAVNEKQGLLHGRTHREKWLIDWWKEASMSIAEIIPAVRALSRVEKFQLAQLLLGDLAGEELPIFKEGQVYPICTPEYAPGAAAQLAQLLKEEGDRS
jgi:hypothetical protein